jgi:hypothetical protein
MCMKRTSQNPRYILRALMSSTRLFPRDTRIVPEARTTVSCNGIRRSREVPLQIWNIGSTLQAAPQQSAMPLPSVGKCHSRSETRVPSARKRRRGLRKHFRAAGKHPKALRHVKMQEGAFVQVGDKGLAKSLVSKGLARTKGVFANLPTGQKSRAYPVTLSWPCARGLGGTLVLSVLC